MTALGLLGCQTDSEEGKVDVEVAELGLETAAEGLAFVEQVQLALASLNAASLTAATSLEAAHVMLLCLARVQSVTAGPTLCVQACLVEVDALVVALGLHSVPALAMRVCHNMPPGAGAAGAGAAAHGPAGARAPPAPLLLQGLRHQQPAVAGPVLRAQERASGRSSPDLGAHHSAALLPSPEGDGG